MQDRAAAVTKVATDWAATSGATIKVVTKNFGDIRDNLGTVAAADAPDVITAAHDWTGQLAANGLVEPIFLSTATKTKFPEYTLNAFSYGTASRSCTAPGVGREHRPRRQHEARQGRRRPSRSSRREALTVKKSEAPDLRHRGAAGLRRRRVPHVPVLLGSRRLRLRHQQGRQPRPVGHRRGEPDLPEERRRSSTSGTRKA